jgi:hypothetical protein
MGSLLPVLVLVTSCGSMARVQRHGGEAADAMDGALSMFEQLEETTRGTPFGLMKLPSRNMRPASRPGRMNRVSASHWPFMA